MADPAPKGPVTRQVQAVRDTRTSANFRHDNDGQSDPVAFRKAQRETNLLIARKNRRWSRSNGKINSTEGLRGERYPGKRGGARSKGKPWWKKGGVDPINTSLLGLGTEKEEKAKSAVKEEANTTADNTKPNLASPKESAVATPATPEVAKPVAKTPPPVVEEPKFEEPNELEMGSEKERAGSVFTTGDDYPSPPSQRKAVKLGKKSLHPSKKKKKSTLESAKKKGKDKKGTKKLETKSEGALFRSITSKRGLGVVEAMENSSGKFKEAQRNERKHAEAAIPTIEQPTGLPKRGGKMKNRWGPIPNSKAFGSPANKPVVKTGKNVPVDKIDTSHEKPETVSFFDKIIAQSKAPKAAKQADQNRYDEAGKLKWFVASDKTPDVDTKFGERPDVPLKGNSDPELADENAEEARFKTTTQMAEFNDAANQDFGEGDIFPDIEVGELRHENELSAGREYEYSLRPLTNISDEHRDILDNDAEDKLRAEADRCDADTISAELDYGNARDAHILEGKAKIVEEEQATSERQLAAKAGASKEISGISQDWEKENQAVVAKFDENLETERSDLDNEVLKRVEEADAAVDEHIKEVEFDAESARVKAEERVAKRREEARKKEAEKSWFDRAIDAVKSFFAKLKAFIVDVFDKLGEYVKKKFEEAKAWVNEKIEDARKAIVGFIEKFGEALKGFVDIAFAAFPTIRDKFKAKIDDAVDSTVNFVNEQAEKLKQFANDVLDTMAAAVDSVLQVMEDVVLGALDVLEVVVIAAIEMADYFYQILKDKILKIATLVAFVALIASGFLLAFMWDFLGEETKEELIDELFGMAIWVFENAPDDMRFGVIWPLFVHGMLGFLYEANETPMAEKKAIMNKISDILTFQDTEFVWHFVINIFVGIWENIWGILEGIWMLVMFITRDMWIMMGELIDWLKEAGPHIAETISLLVDDVNMFVEDFLKEGPEKLKSLLDSKNIQRIMDFLDGIGDELRVKAEVMGAQMAAGVRTFMLSGKASKVIGEKLGWLYGNIIVEVVLAVVTVGIGTAIKQGLNAVKWVTKFFGWFRKLGKAGRAFTHIIEFLGKGFKWLVKTFKKFAKKFVELGQKVLKKFDKLFSGIEKRIDDLMKKLRGKADDVGEHLDDAKGNKRPDADGPDGNRKKNHDDPDGDKKKNKDDDDRKKKDKDDDDDEHAERHTIVMHGHSHAVKISAGKLAKIKFGVRRISHVLRDAKTDEDGAKGKQINAALKEVGLKAGRLRTKAASTKKKVGSSTEYKSFKKEVQEFGRKYEAKDFDKIGDKKGVVEREKFSMNLEPHSIWYDSDNKDGEVWMASGRARHMIKKINDHIKNCDEMIQVLSGESSWSSELTKENALKTRLNSAKTDYETSSRIHKTDLRNSTITRETFAARIENSIEHLAKTLSGIGKHYKLKDLEDLEFYKYFKEIKTIIKELRKNMNNPGADGDGHSNSAYCAERFGWRHITETKKVTTENLADPSITDISTSKRKWKVTSPNSVPNSSSSVSFSATEKITTEVDIKLSLHHTRLFDKTRLLATSLKQIEALEIRSGGQYTKSQMYLDGKMEYNDCELAITDPQKYLISNEVRKKYNLWKEFFPSESLVTFKSRTYWNI